MMKLRYILLLAIMYSAVAPLRADPPYLAAGGYHFVGVNSGQIVGLGDGTYGQLGPSPNDIPATISGLTGVTQVAAGGFSTIALKSDGTVWFLGESTLQHTTPHGTPNASTNFVQVAGLSGIDAIAAGHRHFLALDYDGGQLFAWGHNGSGQLGDGSLLDTGSATLVLTSVASMAAGDGFSLALMSDNTVCSWGRNTHGQLGLADTADRSIPTLVPSVSNAFSVAAGGQHSLILLTNGSVLATGNNAFGQLGLGTTTSTNTPTAVVTLSGITDIAAGYHHSAAIGPANQAYLWGRNFEGQCGGGDTSPVSYLSPQTFTLEAPAMALACGYHFTIFELTNRTVWGTGSNSDGQLDGSSLAGPGDSQKILTPQDVPLILDTTAPTVDAGINMITWSDEPVTLAPIVENNSDPRTDLTYLWSADDPCAVFNPSADVEAPTVTITKVLLFVPFVANGGFEEPRDAGGGFVPYPDGNYDYATDPAGGYYYTWTLPNWGFVGQDYSGVINPTTAMFTSEAPEGDVIGFVEADTRANPGPVTGGLAQVLDVNLAADTVYTLAVKVGNPILVDYAFNTFPGYRVQLLAGGVVLAEDLNSQVVATDTWVTSTVVHTSGGVTDPNVGQPLEIRLVNMGIGQGGSGEDHYVMYDDVTLLIDGEEGVYVYDPTMSTVTLTLAVNNEGNPPEKAVGDTMTIDVYDDSCLAALASGLMIDQTDLDGDCITNFEDFAVMGTKWLDDYKSTGPAVKP